MKLNYTSKMYDYEGKEILPANKDDITPEAILKKHAGDNMHFAYRESIVKAIREYASIHAAKAWDAAIIYESQRDNFLNFCKPITAPNKEEYLKSIK